MFRAKTQLKIRFSFCLKSFDINDIHECFITFARNHFLSMWFYIIDVQNMEINEEDLFGYGMNNKLTIGLLKLTKKGHSYDLV